MPNSDRTPTTDPTLPAESTTPVPWNADEPLRVLFRDLHSTPQGLTSREAARRLEAFGPNELRRSGRRHPVREIVDQLTHPLALLLWVAAALALVISTPVLAVAIVLVIGLNAAFAFIQESQTEKSVEALATYLPQRARVLRDGTETEVAATTLAPGDVMLLEEGDRICADGRLIDGTIEVDTSTLTGESLPLLRSATAQDTGSSLLQASTVVFSGTAVLGGSATALVVRTGMQTELGRIAALSQRAQRDPSPLERQVRRIAWLIAIVAGVVAVAFVPLGMLAGLTIGEAVQFAIGLIVANVPEGLLPTITLALAVGVRELARRGALVKRLSAVETLGSTSVICTDKTGTLTENRMRVLLAWDCDGEVAEGAGRDSSSMQRLADVMALCNTAEQVDGQMRGDATEVALLDFAGRLGEDVSTERRRDDRLLMCHFDPELRRMSTVDRSGDHAVAHVKGAPEEVVALCSRRLAAGRDEDLDDQGRTALLLQATHYAERGLRVLALADRTLAVPPPQDRSDVEADLTFLGLVALVDPPRPEVRAAVEECHAAGIRVIVITGDHRVTAREVAREVGIGGADPRAINAADLESVSEVELDALLAGDTELVLARSSPETKMRVTDALRSSGRIVAMTGDGVNDAPALRRADIGVAMGQSGTDVAREAATMVLTNDNFATIVTAIEAGRRVYDNVRKFVLYIFAHATPELVPFLVFALAGGRVPLPITVLQILAIDIGTETLPALALGREPSEPGIMRRSPRPPQERLLQRPLLLRAWLLLGGISAVLVTFGFFAVLTRGGWTPGADVSPGSPLHTTYLQATTMTFLGIVACQVGVAFAARTERASLWQVGLLTNRLLLAGIAFELVFAAAIVTLPGIAPALGMSLPPAPALAMLLAFPVLVWLPDELMRAILRWRARRA